MTRTDDYIKIAHVAKDAGVPRDQFVAFVSHGYIPLPWQLKYHATARMCDRPDGPTMIGVGGARGPGKSHAVFAQVAIDDCQRQDNLKCLFLRQTGKSASESFDDLIRRVIQKKGLVYLYSRSLGTITFANGSKIILGGFENERDIDKYVGIEYDLMAIEELNQISGEKLLQIRGSLRTSKPNWRPRLYASFNPGNVGHESVKQTFVNPFRMGIETNTRFIPAGYQLNPHLQKEYIEYLQSIPGDLGKAWRDGEWDIFAGQFFPDFSRDKHIIPSFKPNDKHIKVASMDWGYTAPHCVLFHILKEEKTEGGIAFTRVITYREHYHNNQAPDQVAREIAPSMVGVQWMRVDPAMYHKVQDGSISIADQMASVLEDSYRIKPANNDRIGGWALMHNWLSLAPDGLPYWLITENCVNLINSLPTLQHDKNNVEDCDTKGDDHAPDAARYGLVHIQWVNADVGGVGSSLKEKKEYTANMKGERQLAPDLDKFATAFSKMNRSQYYK